jgi:hypothetical protein
MSKKAVAADAFAAFRCKALVLYRRCAARSTRAGTDAGRDADRKSAIARTCSGVARRGSNAPLAGQPRGVTCYAICINWKCVDSRPRSDAACIEAAG